MTLVTKATRGAVAGNGWTSPANATANDASYATAAPAKNGHVTGDWDFAAFTDAEIPVGATINSVTLRYVWKVSTTSSVADATFTDTNGGANDASANDTTEPTADKTTDVAFSTLPTLAELKTAGQVTGHVDAHRGNSNTAVTFSLNYVELRVDYSIVANGDAAITLASPAASGAGAVLAQGATDALLGVLAVTAAGTVLVQGASAAALPPPAASGAGTVATAGTGGDAALTLTSPAAAGAGTVMVTANGTVLLPTLAASGTATDPVTGNASPVLGHASVTSAGAVLVTAQTAQTLTAPLATGAGRVLVQGTGMGQVAIGAGGTGTIGSFVAGDGAATLSLPNAEGRGTVDVAGAFSAALVLTAEATGTAGTGDRVIVTGPRWSSTLRTYW